MRKLIILALLLLPAFFASAQETVRYEGSLADFYQKRSGSEVQGHISFQGVEVNGSLADCMARLRKVARFKPAGKLKTEPLMRGRFGNEEVLLQLGTLPRADLVYVFMISYSPLPTWGRLEARYQNVKMKLTALYGVEPSVREDEPLKYVASYATPQGQVSLVTEEDGGLRIYIIDDENLEIARLMEE